MSFLPHRSNPLASHVPDGWLGLMFRAKAVDKGGIMRRSTLWVEREVGRDRFIDTVRSRGFIWSKTVASSL
jgi:hypothetical protein